MALQHLRSSTANKRPDPTAMAEGQLALNTANASPGLFYKDATGLLIKSGPVHIGATAPNATPAAGGHAGNSVGEAWLDTSGTNPLLKIYNGASFVTVQPVASGTVVSTADTGTVTSTMILDGTILNADINASAAIVDTKLATIATGGKVSNSATTATNANTASAIVARDASGNFTAGTITAALTGAASSNVLKAGDTMTGALVVPLASAATPSLTFTGDLNTGIYSPGADQVAVSTGGTGRLFVDVNGNVKVGSTDNSNAASQYITVGSVGVTDGGLQLWATTTGQSFVQFGDTTTSADQYRGYLQYSHASDFLGLGTASQERLRITSGGLVGIGTSSPDTHLHLYASNASASIRFTNTAASKVWELNPSIPNVANSGFSLHNVTDSTVPLHVTNAGLVGIGDSAPDANSQLHIVGSSYQPLYVNTTAAGGGGAAFFCSGTQALYAGTAGSSWLTGSSTADGLIRSEANLIFATGGNNQRAQIDSSGKLLVGTSTARTSGGHTGSFQLEGTTFATATAAITTNSNDSNGAYLNFGKARGGSVGSTTIVQSGDVCGQIQFNGSDGTSLQNAASITCLVDGTPGASDMPGRLVFSTTADGASSPTERMRITSTGQVRLAGAGITFNGDTAAANELDDYEEGTWTATLDTWSGTAPTTTVTATGQYTKIGRLVHVEVQFSNVSTAGASGDVKITGLPFSGSTGNAANGNCSTYLFDFPSGLTSLSFQVSDSNIAFYISGDNIAWGNLSYSAGSGRYLSIAASYIV
jgi:hypothetical protein